MKLLIKISKKMPILLILLVVTTILTTSELMAGVQMPIKNSLTIYTIDSKAGSSSVSNIWIPNSSHRWHMHELAKNIEHPEEVEKQLMIIEALKNIYDRKVDLVNTVFPEDTLKNLSSGNNGYWEEAIKYHLEIFIREVGDMAEDDDMRDLRQAITDRNAKRIMEIVEIIRAAREASQKALSSEDIAKIREFAKQAQYNAAKAIINKGLAFYASSSVNDESYGAMVTCIFETIEVKFWHP